MRPPAGINSNTDDTEASVARLPFNHQQSQDKQKNSSKMKSFIVLALFVAVAAAAPASPEADAVILKQSLENIGIDGFASEYETSNGIKSSQRGILVDANTENAALIIEGSYEYVGPDGVLYKIVYVADKDGFKPSGAHIPVGP